MKITVVMGSFRKGNTYKIVKQVEEEMNVYGNVEFDYVFLKDIDLGFCKSCHMCFEKGESECGNSQAIKELVTKLDNSDGFIFASPVYSLHVTSLMKNFIDHTSYIFHRPRYYDKKAMVISSTAGAGAKTVVNYLSDVLRFWGVNNVHKLAHSIFDIKLNMTPRLRKKISKKAKMFYQDLDSRKRYNPSLKRIVMYNAWKYNATVNDENNPDHIYWKKKGFMYQDYYFKLPLHKRVFSKFIFLVLKTLFK